MRVLTWNLFHGRAVPDRPHDLLPEFARTLASWDWDVALLQEVFPWWPLPLARASRASMRMARTSRNWILPPRRFAAERRPDLIKSNGGGSNAILVRGDARIREQRRATLRRLPEHRVVHAVRLDDGTWVGNLHAQGGAEARAQADLDRAAHAVLGWAGPRAPVVLGGDLNTRRPVLPGLTVAGREGVDAVAARGLHAEGAVELPDRGGLSDHPAVLITLGKDGAPPGV